MAERVVRPRRRLRAGLAQLVCAGLGRVLGLLLPRIDGGWRVDATRATEVLLSVGPAIVGVTSVIFSLPFLVVQWAAGNFTPRLALFRTDPMVWRTFAFVMGLLVYTTTATLAIGAKSEVSVWVPVTTVVLTVITLSLVRNLQLRAFQSIQLAHVLATTTERAHKVIDAFYPDTTHKAGTTEAGVTPPLPQLRATVSWPGTTTTVEQLDILGLTNAATRADAVVVMRVQVGSTIQRGTRIADIRGGDLPEAEVVRAIVAGQERTFHQDPLFALRLLADIGLRALSPAVNDPATAVQVLDALEGLLGRLTTDSLDAGSVTDDKDAVRVVLRMPAWTEFVRISLDDLFAAATKSPMVLLRTRRMLLALLDVAQVPDRRVPLTSRLRWVEQELTDRFPLYWQEAVAEAPTM
ncbi:DUF2254 family protein [Streptacidiphilus sp. EB129]|uniref:DUF2254 family protein n=1 Tax=Streptacidiphilus sp. EB129 TaxID=3156262 RepID=UPI0035125022